MDTQSLKAFLAVAGAHSFSAAAEQLHLTQSAVSKRIQQLETQLGVALFERHNRTVSLTDAGTALLPRARSILDLVADTTQQMENLTGDIAGSLSIATSHHIGLHRLPPVLRKFVQAHPNVDLDLQFMGSERAYQAVRLRQVDLALTTLEQTPKTDIAAIPLWQDDMVCVCANSHRLAGISKISLQDLSTESAILPEPDTITYQLINNVFAAEGLTLKAPMPTNYLETIKMLVSVGMGWSVLPASMINDEALTIIDWPGASLRRQLGAVFLKHRTQSNAAAALLKLLHASADD